MVRGAPLDSGEFIELLVVTGLLGLLVFSLFIYRQYRARKPASSLPTFNMGMSAAELEKLVSSGALTDEERQQILARRNQRVKAAIPPATPKPGKEATLPAEPPREAKPAYRPKPATSELREELRALMKLDDLQLDDLVSAGLLSQEDRNAIRAAKAGAP